MSTLWFPLTRLFPYQSPGTADNKVKVAWIKMLKILVDLTSNLKCHILKELNNAKISIFAYKQVLLLRGRVDSLQCYNFKANSSLMGNDPRFSVTYMYCKRKKEIIRKLCLRMFTNKTNSWAGWVKQKSTAHCQPNHHFFAFLKMFQRTVMGGLDTVKMFQALYVQSTMFYTIAKLSCWFFMKSVTGTLKVNDKILHPKVLLSKFKWAPRKNS